MKDGKHRGRTEDERRKVTDPLSHVLRREYVKGVLRPLAGTSGTPGYLLGVSWTPGVPLRRHPEGGMYYPEGTQEAPRRHPGPLKPVKQW